MYIFYLYVYIFNKNREIDILQFNTFQNFSM